MINQELSKLDTKIQKILSISIKHFPMQATDLTFDTKIGRVHITKKEAQIPQGFKVLDPQEAYWIRKQLHAELQSEIQDLNIALSEGTVCCTYGGLTISESQDNSNAKYIATIKPNDLCLRIADYEHYTQLVKKHEFTILPIGLVLIVQLQIQAPEGFRRMNIQQVYEYKHQIKPLLGQWSIIAFENGKIDGSGYGNKISNTYGTECSQMLIVSTEMI